MATGEVPSRSLRRVACDGETMRISPGSRRRTRGLVRVVPLAPATARKESSRPSVVDWERQMSPMT